MISSDTRPLNVTPVSGLTVKVASAFPARPVAPSTNNPFPPLTVSSGVTPSPSCRPTFLKAIVTTVVGVAPTVDFRSTSKSPVKICPATVNLAGVEAFTPRTSTRKYLPPGMPFTVKAEVLKTSVKRPANVTAVPVVTVMVAVSVPAKPSLLSSNEPLPWRNWTSPPKSSWTWLAVTEICEAPDCVNSKPPVSAEPRTSSRTFWPETLR